MNKDFLLYIAILIISASGFIYLSQPLIEDLNKPIKQPRAAEPQMFDVIAIGKHIDPSGNITGITYFGIDTYLEVYYE